MKRGAKVQISQLDPEGEYSSSSSSEETVTMAKKPATNRVISIPTRRTQESGNIINPFKTATKVNTMIVETRELGLKEREKILSEIEKLNSKFVAAVNSCNANDRYTDFTSLFPQYTKYREEIQRHFGILKDAMSKLSTSAPEVTFPSPPNTQMKPDSPMKIDHPIIESSLNNKPPFSFNAAATEFRQFNAVTANSINEQPPSFNIPPLKPLNTLTTNANEKQPGNTVPSFKPFDTTTKNANEIQPPLISTELKPFSFSAPTSEKLEPFAFISSSKNESTEAKPIDLSTNTKEKSEAKAFTFNASANNELKPFSFNTPASGEAKPFNINVAARTSEETKAFTFNAPLTNKPFSFESARSETTMKPFSFPTPPSTSQISFSFSNNNNPTNPTLSKEVEEEESEDGESPTLPEEPVNKELVQKGEGEEAEVTEWQARSKLFRFENGAWKDLGIGLAKVNQQQQEGKRRLLMRAEGTGKVLLNIDLKGIIADFKAERPTEIIMITSHDGAKYLLRSKEQLAPLDQILKNSVSAQSN